VVAGGATRPSLRILLDIPIKNQSKDPVYGWVKYNWNMPPMVIAITMAATAM
jgi:hypothetical protein